MVHILSFNISNLRFTHVVKSLIPSLLLLSTIPLYGSTIILSIYSSADADVISKCADAHLSCFLPFGS